MNGIHVMYIYMIIYIYIYICLSFNSHQIIYTTILNSSSNNAIKFITTKGQFAFIQCLEKISWINLNQKHLKPSNYCWMQTSTQTNSAVNSTNLKYHQNALFERTSIKLKRNNKYKYNLIQLNWIQNTINSLNWT